MRFSLHSLFCHCSLSFVLAAISLYSCTMPSDLMAFDAAEKIKSIVYYNLSLIINGVSYVHKRSSSASQDPYKDRLNSWERYISVIIRIRPQLTRSLHNTKEDTHPKRKLKMSINCV